ncbi:MAG: exodeoxyribonuclease III [Planctomycetota bacterium]|jgi:exodeoxyribonuclease-3
MRLVTLNMNGIRAAVRKGVWDWLAAAEADVVCLQETRIKADQLKPALDPPEGFNSYHLHAEKPGYSSVAILSRREPDRLVEGIGWEDFDREARVLRADFDGLSVVSLYLPSGSSKDERQLFKEASMARLVEWMHALREEREEVVVCGDWNIAHTEKDIKNARGNRNNSGFLPQERAWMDELFGDHGWHDVFRRLHPEAEGEGYTWWSNRGQAFAKNVGWRIDYQVASAGLAASAAKAWVVREPRFSDHAPLLVDYDLPWPG